MLAKDVTNLTVSAFYEDIPELTKVLELIITRAIQGEFYLVTELTDDVVIGLRDLGYKVYLVVDVDSPIECYAIHWN